LDSEALDKFREFVGFFELYDELSLLASSNGSFSFLLGFLFSFGGNSSGLKLGNLGITVSAQKFADLNSDSDGIAESMEFNIIEIHQEELGEEDVEASISLGRDLNFVAGGVDELLILIFH